MTPEQEQIVLSNLKLVHKVCQRYVHWGKNCGFEYDDLFQTGVEGLIKAVLKFDESKGFRFSTYAVHAIRGTISNEIRRKRFGPHYSRRIVDLNYEISRRFTMFEPSEVIAEALGEPIKDVRAALEYEMPPKSLDWSEAGKDGDQIDYMDYVGKETDYTWNIVREFISSLSDRYKLITAYTMFDENQTRIGKRIGVTQTTVWRNLKKIEKELKQYLEVV